MKTIKIIEIKNKIANGEEVPKRIRYDLLRDEYQVLVYDADEMEYRYENDFEEFWEVPNHHLNDEVEILEDEECYKFSGIKFFQDGECVMAVANETPTPVDDEDEFEDIDELNYIYQCNMEGKIMANFERYKEFINILVRNQKKLIEKVKELE
jgi:hypothetical protein